MITFLIRYIYIIHVSFLWLYHAIITILLGSGMVRSILHFVVFFSVHNTWIYVSEHDARTTEYTNSIKSLQRSSPNNLI